MTAKIEVIAKVTLVTADGQVLPGSAAMVDADEAPGLIARGYAVKVNPAPASDAGDGDAEAPTGADLKALTVAKLRERAAELGIEGASGMKKAEMLAAIEEAEKGDKDGDGDIDSRDEVVSAVAVAILGLGDPESNSDAFTTDGDPKLEVLSEAVGYEVDAAVRADAMALLAKAADDDGEAAETEGGEGGDAGDGAE